MKQTLQEKLLKRQVKLPNGLLYWILMQVVKVLNRRINTSFRFKADPRKDKDPFILISNHASRVDYQFTGPACYPNKLNYVVGYNEFVRFPGNADDASASVGQRLRAGDSQRTR